MKAYKKSEFMSMLSRIKSNPRLKALVLKMITSPRNPRPKWWVRNLAFPFFAKRGKGSVIRRRSRMDIFPWNPFQIGRLSTIEDFTTVNNGSGAVILGDRVRVGIGSVIIGPVTMKSGSGLGQHVFISGFNHGYKDGSMNSSQQPLDIKPVLIEEEAHIGANSVVVAGVTIGRRSQVGAGSVVTKDIPPFSVAVGNPARVIKKYNEKTGNWERV